MGKVSLLWAYKGDQRLHLVANTGEVPYLATRPHYTPKLVTSAPLTHTQGPRILSQFQGSLSRPKPKRKISEFFPTFSVQTSCRETLLLGWTLDFTSRTGVGPAVVPPTPAGTERLGGQGGPALGLRIQAPVWEPPQLTPTPGGTSWSSPGHTHTYMSCTPSNSICCL